MQICFFPKCSRTADNVIWALNTNAIGLRLSFPESLETSGHKLKTKLILCLNNLPHLLQDAVQTSVTTDYNVEAAILYSLLPPSPHTLKVPAFKSNFKSLKENVYKTTTPLYK